MSATVAVRLKQLMRGASVWRDTDGQSLLDQLRSGVEPRLARSTQGAKLRLVHFACRHGWLSFVKSLIEDHRCDPHAMARDSKTPLHYACRYGRFDIVRYLISEQHCSPEYYGISESPLSELFVTQRKCSEEEAVKIMKFLLSIAKCDINTKDNRNNNTVLHIACHASETDEIPKLLMTHPKIDRNAKNDDGNTPLHLVCRNVNLNLAQLLVRDERCNPHEKNGMGDTALHIVCRFRYTGMEVSKLLLEEAKLDPNTKSDDGNTPLHLVCRNVNLDSVKLLVRDERCNPHEKNGMGDTALHVVCRLTYTGMEISKFLLEEAKLDPNAKNNDGDTPLHLACWNVNFSVVQLLIRDERCKANEKDSKGDTALHIACCLKTDENAIPKLLLEEGRVDPNAKNSDGLTPLDLTSDPDVIRELIRHGANPQNVYQTHGKALGKHSSKQPLQTPVKLFMVGNASAGKSTLVKALQSEMTYFVSLVTRSRPVSGVDEKTAGIVPHEFESKIYGRVTLYDFAGQREFYGSHAALLKNAIQTSTPIFLLVVDLSASNDDIKSNIFYWLSFLENQCTSVSRKPHIVVIGSHADVLKSKDEVTHKARFITSVLTAPEFASLEFTGFVAMDCQYADSAGMRQLHQALKTSCDSLRSHVNINFNAHCFLVYLLDKFRNATALTLATISAQIKEDLEEAEGSAKDFKSFVPSSIDTLYAICDQLNDRGHLLVLRNPSAIEYSWVIINRTALLAEVNGTIFAPEGFKEHIKLLASSTGVVPLSNLAKYFPKHDQYMLVGFLSHLEFCSEISDLETLHQISQEQTSTASEATAVQGERYFFFPGLVTLEVPSTVWEPQPQFDYHCGWILQCSRPEQFFGPRFLQVLLLKLAISCGLCKCPSTDVPSLQCKCSIWKNGIYWGNEYIVETLVEVTDQNRVVVLMQCPEVKSECLQLRSFLIQKVLAAAREFCSKVSIVESFINPSDTTQYPLKPTAQLALYDITEVATAIAKGVPAVVNDSGSSVSLDSLLSFEPYADLGEANLCELFAAGRQKFTIFSIAERIPNKNTEMIKKIFKPSPTQLRDRMSGGSIASPVYHVLDMWRDSCEGTYQCLREKLDQYSVFAGRNPLEIAGLSDDCSAVATPKLPN